MPDFPNTRLSLLVRLQNPADELAWAEFVGIYEPAVYGFARKKGLQDADARDLCQEVLRRVAGAIDRWDPDPCKGPFRAWLFRIARNVLINLAASQQRHRGTGESDVQELLEAQPAGELADSALFDLAYKRQLFRWAAEAIRAEFSSSTWDAFWRTAVEAQETKAVARELGLSTGAVYIARSRIITRLRERIDAVEGRTVELEYRLFSNDE
jgi:RNA polymerase sigma-70 factor (ECF subfamily)